MQDVARPKAQFAPRPKTDPTPAERAETLAQELTKAEASLNERGARLEKARQDRATKAAELTARKPNAAIDAAARLLNGEVVRSADEAAGLERLRAEIDSLDATISAAAAQLSDERARLCSHGRTETLAIAAEIREGVSAKYRAAVANLRDALAEVRRLNRGDDATHGALLDFAPDAAGAIKPGDGLLVAIYSTLSRVTRHTNADSVSGPFGRELQNLMALVKNER